MYMYKQNVPQIVEKGKQFQPLSINGYTWELGKEPTLEKLDN